MRQGPHKNRSRSRGRRPTGNQSGRVYESNGPDVKVRGTAQTVADKYLQLARDAHSVGDTVMAEGYFQHAEHYLRIVAASQPAPQQNPPQRRDDYSYDDDEGDDDQPMPVASGMGNGGNGERQPQQQQVQPQPQQPAAAEANDGESSGQSGGQSGGQDGDQPWGGPEPEFLRRGPDNGSTRTRRPRQSRKSNGRKDPAASSDEKGSSGDSNPGQDTTEQA
ncbi:MAG: DUF4167 domain-containing protein [Hyphomicrobiales bacterium]